MNVTNGNQAAQPAGTRATLERALRQARAPFLKAVVGDAVAFAVNRGESFPRGSRVAKLIAILRLMWVADDFLCLALYRLRMSLHGLHVPIIPRLIHLLCVQVSGIRIGDYCVLEPGIYIPHGEIVIDGIVRVGRGCVLCPWITLGLMQGRGIDGPTLEERVFVGTGAKILGAVRVGAGALVGANAVVLADVPPGMTAVGVPARVVRGRAAPDATASE